MLERIEIADLRLWLWLCCTLQILVNFYGLSICNFTVVHLDQRRTNVERVQRRKVESQCSWCSVLSLVLICTALQAFVSVKGLQTFSYCFRFQHCAVHS